MVSEVSEEPVQIPRRRSLLRPGLDGITDNRRFRSDPELENWLHPFDTMAMAFKDEADKARWAKIRTAIVALPTEAPAALMTHALIAVACADCGGDVDVRLLPHTPTQADWDAIREKAGGAFCLRVCAAEIKDNYIEGDFR